MYDLVYYYPQGHERHQEPGHPERPERVEAIRAGLEEVGWWQEHPHLSPIELSVDVLGRVHAPAYLMHLQAAGRAGEWLDLDTYTTPDSWNLALLTAGGAAAVAEAVWKQEARRGFALCRPPGHHATPQRGMGFCLLNNTALAAEYLLQKEGALRLAILDLDLHHGNGTQDIFWERNDVFYLSAHQSPLYPGSGGLEEIGAGSGKGATANFPMPPGSGDDAFAAVLTGAIFPLLGRFEPEMVLVSFGFDPHWMDPLGLLQMSADGFRQMAAELSGWADNYCGGKIAYFLEGGYDLQAGAVSGQAVVAGLLNRAWTDPLGPDPRPAGEAWIPMLQKVINHWDL